MNRFLKVSFGILLAVLGLLVLFVILGIVLWVTGPWETSIQ